MHVSYRGMLVLTLIAGCSKTGSSTASHSGSAVAASTSGSAGSGSAALGSASSGSAAAKAATDDPAARAAYRAGMRQGRKATDAKQWADAIAGFDKAIAAKPGDARAISERGFARLLEATDLAAAEADFDRAAGATKDPKLLSTIWFNRGLLAEKRGQADNALAAFAIANDLRPTAAAAKKLAGKATCPVSINYAFSVPDHPMVEAANWVALAKAMEIDDEPTDDAAAIESLTGDKAVPKLPVVVVAHSAGIETAFLVTAKAGAGLRATPLGTAMEGRCPGTAYFEIVGSQGTNLHVHGREEDEGGMAYMCKAKNGDVVECEGKPGEEDAGTACLGGSESTRDLVIDPASGKVLAVAEQPSAEDATKMATVKLTDKGFELSGQGCNRTAPLSP